MRFCATAGAAALLALLGGCGLTRAGLFAADAEPVGGPCQVIEGFPGGTEDITVDHAARRIYVSADDRRNGGGGGLFVLGFDALRTGARPLPAWLDQPQGFRPHGLGLWSGPDGARRLFVVHHPEGAPSRVEVFDVLADGGLRLTSDGAQTDLLHRPNDVAPFGPRAFYATNDHQTRGRTASAGFWETMEAVFSWNGATVVRVDETSAASVVARGLTFANGVALSPDATTLYVAETVDGRVRAYRREADDGLTEVRRTDVGVGPDNLTVHPDGRVWIGAHDRLLSVSAHAGDPSKLSPGRAVSLAPDGRLEPPSFRTRGADLSALSVAAQVEDRLVLGSIYAPRLLVCPLARS